METTDITLKGIDLEVHYVYSPEEREWEHHFCSEFYIDKVLVGGVDIIDIVYISDIEDEVLKQIEG